MKWNIIKNCIEWREKKTNHKKQSIWTKNFYGISSKLNWRHRNAERLAIATPSARNISMRIVFNGGSILQSPFRRNRKQRHEIWKLLKWKQKQWANRTQDEEITDASAYIYFYMYILNLYMKGWMLRESKDLPKLWYWTETELPMQRSERPLLGACVCLRVCIWFVANAHEILLGLCVTKNWCMWMENQDAPATKIAQLFQNGVTTWCVSLCALRFGSSAGFFSFCFEICMFFILNFFFR